MEKKFKRTTVTSALPYANGPVHIGHLAGVYVPADIYVRYLRLKKEVFRRVRRFLRRVQPYYFKDASRHGFRLLPQAVR